MKKDNRRTDRRSDRVSPRPDEGRQDSAAPGVDMDRPRESAGAATDPIPPNQPTVYLPGEEIEPRPPRRPMRGSEAGTTT